MNPTSTDTSAILDGMRQTKERYALSSPSGHSSSSKYIVEGMLSLKQAGFIVGESGIGKSPLAYQLGISVAHSILFLGERTNQTAVLYIDFENTKAQGDSLEKDINAHLGVEPSDHFLRWHESDCAEKFGVEHNLENIVEEWSKSVHGPKLVIPDPLRHWYAGIDDPEIADTQVRKLRLLTRGGAAVLGIHHTRRRPPEQPRQSGEPPGRSSVELEFHPREWILTKTRGADAMITGLDVRLGFDACSCPAAVAKGIELNVLSGFGRVHGQIGPFHLERAVNEDGDPIAYQRYKTLELLTSEAQRLFERLPDRFRYKYGRSAYEGRSEKQYNKYLHDFQGAGLLRRDGKWYLKTP